MVVSEEKPRTAEELAQTLHRAAQEKLAVVPVGGGRARGMGNPLERSDVLLHTTRLDRVIEHSQADMVVSVEAGITLEKLESQLGKAGQFLPLDPFNSPGHTIGGLLATGWTGPLRLRYGSPRDFLIGIRVALPDGKLASAGGRVVKNVSGYDLMKLHFGALGSLGVIVAASFKVFPKPLHEVTVTSRGGWADAERALSAPIMPVALELFSDGHVLAEFAGSRDAINRVVEGLGWTQAEPSVWDEHGRRAPAIWARIAVPRQRLRDVVSTLPESAEWWASPGTGIAHWSVASDPQIVRDVRLKAEAEGGSLVLLTAPDDFMQELGAWGKRPSTIEVMRRIKKAFDPDGILNPGRFVV
ncbi:MAG TPA: FAD-binding oxidoreductase [Candidatus Dormibacteraeota bacterium]|nr:FAD-binding oxidoreductase [Candidatus Dormibacteraeota bacterium]